MALHVIKQTAEEERGKKAYLDGPQGTLTLLDDP